MSVGSIRRGLTCTPLVRVAHVPLLSGPAAAATTSRALLLCPRGCGRLLLLRELGLREPEAIRLPRRGHPRRTRANADALHLAGKVPSIVLGGRVKSIGAAGQVSNPGLRVRRPIPLRVLTRRQSRAPVRTNSYTPEFGAELKSPHTARSRSPSCSAIRALHVSSRTRHWATLMSPRFGLKRTVFEGEGGTAIVSVTEGPGCESGSFSSLTVDVGNPEAPVVRGFFRSKAVDNRHVLLQVMVCELDPLGADGPEGIRTPEGCTPLR